MTKYNHSKLLAVVQLEYGNCMHVFISSFVLNLITLLFIVSNTIKQ